LPVMRSHRSPVWRANTALVSIAVSMFAKTALQRKLSSQNTGDCCNDGHFCESAVVHTADLSGINDQTPRGWALKARAVGWCCVMRIARVINLSSPRTHRLLPVQLGSSVIWRVVTANFVNRPVGPSCGLLELGDKGPCQIVSRLKTNLGDMLLVIHRSVRNRT
jgi:hypothetical protein